jgi:hypothetical protein
VEVRGALDEAESPAHLLDAKEPSEEDEHVTGPHVLARQHLLRGAALAEQASPPGRARPRRFIEIGVEVDTKRRRSAPARQVANEWAERSTTDRHVLEGDGRMATWDR